MSLVEIMVALVIGLILMAGVIQIFLGSKQTSRMQDALTRLQENGRFAMHFLVHDIRKAGYWGCQSRMHNLNNNLDNAVTGYIDFNKGAVIGTDGAASTDPDSITLQGTKGAGITIETPYMVTPSADLHIASNSGIKQGDILMVSDCNAADIFQVTNANPGSGSLVHALGNSGGNPGNIRKELSKTYAGDAQIYAAFSNSYTVQAGANGEPALFLDSGSGPQELVGGIQNMQILYGEDTDPIGATGYGTVNRWVSASNVSDWLSVIAVRVTLLVESHAEVKADKDSATTYNVGDQVMGPFNDRRLRIVLSDTAAIRNRLQ